MDMATHERAPLEPELRRIVDMLSWTDMTLTQIAEHMKCSIQWIVLINEDFGVRSVDSPLAGSPRFPQQITRQSYLPS
jgi:hypothetical protein